MDKWEYWEGHISKCNLNSMGQKGWELAGTFPTGNIIFKRHIPEAPTQTVSIEKQNTPYPELSF